jgi:type IX secretion system PorP/SprF family membrane protein
MKQKFTYLILIVVLCIPKLSDAQQDPQYTQYMFNRLAINPAYAGVELGSQICATVLHRQQWVGYESTNPEFSDGPPTTTTFNIHSRLPFIRHIDGAGFHATQDQLGFMSSVNMGLSLSYRFDLGPGQLGVGVTLGVTQSSLDGDWICPDGDCSQDENIPDGEESAIEPDFNAGLYYHMRNFYAGVSATHLHEPELGWGTSDNRWVRTYYFTSGYNYMLNQNLDIRPSTMVKYDGTKLQFDVTALAVLQDRFWGGVSYRHEDAVSAIIGLRFLQNFQLGYSYDITTSDMAGVSDGSHEIMFRYCFQVRMRDVDDAEIPIITPRFL